MAIIHQATLQPSKLELLSGYLPTIVDLGVADGAGLTALGAYRFDDPAGAVGIEAHLIATPDGRTIHMPLTYRAEPLTDAEAWLVGTLEHSVLGTRWVYNGAGDPVYLAELTRTILTAATQVKLEVQTPDGPVERDNVVHVRGSGPTDGSDGATFTAHIVSVVDDTLPPTDVAHLAGTWPGRTDPACLAALH